MNILLIYLILFYLKSHAELIKLQNFRVEEEEEVEVSHLR